MKIIFLPNIIFFLFKSTQLNYLKFKYMNEMIFWVEDSLTYINVKIIISDKYSASQSISNVSFRRKKIVKLTCMVFIYLLTIPSIVTYQAFKQLLKCQ